MHRIEYDAVEDLSGTPATQRARDQGAAKGLRDLLAEDHDGGPAKLRTVDSHVDYAGAKRLARVTDGIDWFRAIDHEGSHAAQLTDAGWAAYEESPYTDGDAVRRQTRLDDQEVSARGD